MAKDEQGFMDWLVEDICNTIEIKGAVEASRDENGKVDKWKATGLAMGLNHTSDDEMATLAGFLGAEGAFDSDDSITNDDDIADDFEDIPISTVTPTFRINPTNYISETEYENKKKSIIWEKRSIIGMSIFALCLFTIVFLKAMNSYPDGTVVYLLMLLVFDSSLIYAIINTSNARERELSALEQKYTESKNNQKQEEKVKIEQDTAKKEFETLKNYIGTTDLFTARNIVFNKAESLFNEADKVCDINESSYNSGIIENLLTFILFFAIENSKITLNQKSATFDIAISYCFIQSEFTGDMLFSEQNSELTEAIQKALDEFYSLITIAVHKSGQTGVDMDFTKSLCSMMILLGEKLDKQCISKEIGTNGVRVILETAQRTAQRVIDERLLDDPAEETTVCDDSADSNVNMDSVMNKVEKLASDNEFLSRKLAGKEFEITCDSCKSSVKITVTSELTGNCPICGYENKLTFSIK